MTNLKAPASDSLITFKSVLLFVLLTILNISIFVVLVYENQIDLITKNAELESKDKGILIKVRVEEIVTGQGIGLLKQRWDAAAAGVPVFEGRDVLKKVVDTLPLGRSVGVEYELGGWLRISTKRGQGWVMAGQMVRHVPAVQTGVLSAEDVNLILSVLEAEGITGYSIFTESGAILVENGGETRKEASIQEKQMIKKAIFKANFENMAFYHAVDRANKRIDLYIPIQYGINKVIVLKPVINMRYIWEQTRILYRQAAVIGGLLVLLHILFVVLNQWFIIKPMVRERTNILEAKNWQVLEAKNKLQMMFNELNMVHNQIQQELDIAREVQQAMLPSELPDVLGYEFHAHYLPAEKVGGDFYDLMWVDDEHLGILMADVSGHGVPAAFIMTMAKMSFVTHGRGQLSSKGVLERINKDLLDTIPSLYYLTAFYMILHVKSGRFTYTRASHPAPFHYQRGPKLIQTLDTAGMLVGMFSDPKYAENNGMLEPGDRIVLFTDGLNETLNPDKKQYGLSRISSSILYVADKASSQISNRILEDVVRYKQGQSFEDDVALLIVGRTAKID